jgi:hypothetical protein
MAYAVKRRKDGSQSGSDDSKISKSWFSERYLERRRKQAELTEP